MADVSQPNKDWSDLYEWNRDSLDTFRNQLDRLAENIESIGPNIVSANQAVANVASAAQAMAGEAQRAKQAWSKADEVADKIAHRAAKSANASATKAVEDSLIKLNLAASSIQTMDQRLTQSVAALNWYWYIFLAILVAACGLSLYAGFQLGRSHDDTVKERIDTLKAYETALERMFTVANKEQKKVLQDLLNKAYTVKKKTE